MQVQELEFRNLQMHKWFRPLQRHYVMDGVAYGA
jgi:hypothetical protein